MQYGVQADRIIFANPCKCPSHIKYAKKMNVEQITADSELELLKIKDLYSEAKWVCEIAVLTIHRVATIDILLLFFYPPNSSTIISWFNRIVIRIRCDAKNSECNLGLKFGCEPDEDAVRLIQLTANLGLTLHGFSFHVGSPCGELNAYSRGIGICKRLIAIAKSMGCLDVQLIDIGGGFSGETDIDKVYTLCSRVLISFYFIDKIILKFIF